MISRQDADIFGRKGDFEDILQNRRSSSDVIWAMKRMTFPSYRFCQSRTPSEIKEAVISSARIRHTIEEVSQKTGKSPQMLHQMASSILDEMAHNYNLASVRVFAMMLPKIFKSLYRHIYVNQSRINQLRSLMNEYPVVFLPTHRSYIDFLLVSYVCFHYDLTIPVVAAAQDFLGMRFVSTLLRNSGAFFIHRTGSTPQQDPLYWSLLNEYIQQHLHNGDAPVEFFIEGTRSRTGKWLLPPKLGMLSMCLEAYVKGQVPDMFLVPVSITYDRILEENLYAYELLGVPKPKESMSGLLRARSILAEDFGSIHAVFGEPISVRELMSSVQSFRTYHGLRPLHLGPALVPEELDAARKIALTVIERQQHQSIIPVTALIAAVLLAQEGPTVNVTRVALAQLTREVDWLRKQAINLGCVVDWNARDEAEQVVTNQLTLLRHVLRLCQDGSIELDVPPKRSLDEKSAAKLSESLAQNAAAHLILASMRNQLMHVFDKIGPISAIICGSEKEAMTVDELYLSYCFLAKILSREFLFIPDKMQQDFDNSLLHLSRIGAVQQTDGPTSSVVVRSSVNKLTAFMSRLFEPFLLLPWISAQYILLHRRASLHDQKKLIEELQSLVARMLEEDLIRHYECLSLTAIRTSLEALCTVHALKHIKGKVASYTADYPVLDQVITDLGRLLEFPKAPLHQFIAGNKDSVIHSAKL